MDDILGIVFIFAMIYFVPLAINAIFHPIKTTKVVANVATAPIRNKKIFDYLERSLFLLEPNSIASHIDDTSGYIIDKNHLINLFLFETMSVITESVDCHMRYNNGVFRVDQTAKNILDYIIKKEALFNIYYEKYLNTAQILKHKIQADDDSYLDYNYFKVCAMQVPIVHS